jgi:uncharacterized membrane protein YphA (DoxX/SURF4 family)
MQSPEKTIPGSAKEGSRFMHRFLRIGARIVLGGVFLYAGFDKVLHPAAFAEAVFNYQILPDFLVNLTAVILPWLELTLGVLLISGIWIPGSAVLGTLLLAIFMGAMVFNLARGLDIDCGCFSLSASGGRLTLRTILRDAVFLLPAVYLLIEVFSSGSIFKRE